MKRWTIVTGLVCLFLGSAMPAWAQLVDLRADYPKGECLKKASPAQSARFRITGPGHLEVHLYLDPYRHAGRAGYVPLLWKRYPTAGKRETGWGEMGAALEGQGHPNHFFQGGKEAGSWAEGVAWEMVSTFDVAQGEFDIGAMIAPCAMMYGCGYSQWQQRSRLVITFAPKGASSPKAKTAAPPSTPPPPTATTTDIAGTWTMEAGGYGNTLEITRSGGGYSARWWTGNGPKETMKDFRFDPASGAVEFIRPLKGYPNQIFQGKLEGGRLSGSFSFVTSKTSKTGWKAVRIK
jgi:hypothetical protein